jgi:energy coupling factor transporter S component ThiW
MTNVKIATSAILAALGVALSWINPFAYIPIFGIKINPFAHLINVIAGVLLGPWYALCTATAIAVIRFGVGIGSPLAFPGGMSGAIVVGLIRDLLLRKRPQKVNFAALSEPVGTVFIGATLASPMTFLMPDFFANPTPLFTMWLLFALPSIFGCIIGWLILKILDRAGLSATFLPAAVMGSCAKREDVEGDIQEKSTAS